MLDIKDLIAIEWRKNTSKGYYRIYLFKCKTCPNLIKSRKSHFKNHKGSCISCSSKETIKLAGLACRLRPFEAKYNIFKYKCPETNLVYEDYLEFTNILNCDYCERIMPWKAYGENNPGFWLDRKNNNLGHVKGNLVVCCGLCNFTKRGEFSYDEFKLLGVILKEIRLKRELNESISRK